MEDKQELFALVELFGHSRIAGKVSDYQVGGASFVRIDVPASETEPAFTRFLHPNAIYAINPISEMMMKAMAERIKSKPIDIWDAEEIINRVNSARQLGEKQANTETEEEEEEPFKG